MTVIRIVTTLAVTILALPAHAQTGSRDVRCLMLSNLFSKAVPAAQAKEAAGQARLFYLGRVSGKIPPAQLEATMVLEAKTIVPDRAGPDMNKCLASVQAAAEAIEAAGRKAASIGGAKPLAH